MIQISGEHIILQEEDRDPGLISESQRTLVVQEVEALGRSPRGNGQASTQRLAFQDGLTEQDGELTEPPSKSSARSSRPPKLQLQDVAKASRRSPRSDPQAPIPLSSRSMGSSASDVSAAPRFLRMQIAHDVNSMLEQTLEVHRQQSSGASEQQVRLLEALVLEQTKIAEQIICIQECVLGCEQKVVVFGEALEHSQSKILETLQKRQVLEDNDEDGVSPIHTQALKTDAGDANPLVSLNHEAAENAKCWDSADLDDTLAENAEIINLKRQGPLQRFVTGHVFEFVCASVIILNAVHSAVVSQVSIAHAVNNIGTGELQLASLLLTSGYLFNVFYTVELVFRLAVFKARYFYGDDWKWNVFDFMLVLAGICDIVWLNIQSGSSVDIKWLRMLRLLKMMKMLRVIRVMHFFQELRVLVSAIQISGKTMLWLIVMLLIILFVFSMCFLQGITSWLNETPPGEVDSEHLRAIQNDFRTVPGTMLTLFCTISGGKQWAEVAIPLWSAGRMYYYMFLVYISFTLFTVLNVITGIYVDAAMKIATNDYDTVVTEIINTEKRNQTRIKEIFSGFDNDRDGSLTLRELEVKLLDEKARAFFQAFQIEPNDAKRVFRMIVGKDINKALGVDEFLNGCIRLKGAAKSIDMFCIQADRKFDRERQNVFMEYVEDSMEASREAFRKMGFKHVEVLPLHERFRNQSGAGAATSNGHAASNGYSSLNGHATSSGVAHL